MKVVEKIILAVSVGTAISTTVIAVVENRKSKKAKRQFKETQENLSAMEDKVKASAKKATLAKSELDQKTTEANKLKEDLNKMKEELSKSKEEIDAINTLNETMNGKIFELTNEISEKEQIITQQADELIYLRVDTGYRPVGKSFKILKVKTETKNLNYKIYGITIKSEEEIRRPRISDEHFKIRDLSNGDKYITIKRDADEEYGHINSLVRKCGTIDEIFALHNNKEKSMNTGA